MTYPIQIYISHSNRDRQMKEQLITYLKSLERQGLINILNDQGIPGGENWEALIDTQMSRASIILLLVSPDYLASDWCYEIEARRALERMETDGIKVVQIILKRCDWFYAPFGRLQALPMNGKPINEWRKRPDAYIDVAERVKQIVYQFEQGHIFISNLSLSEIDIGQQEMPQFTGKTLIIHGHARQDRLELQTFSQNNLGASITASATLYARYPGNWCTIIW